MNDKAVVKIDDKSVAVAPIVTPMVMLQMAVDKGADLDQLQKLMDLQERWESNEARKAFHSAMNDFKSDPPEITKDKHVEYGTTKYAHSSLGNIADAISERMSKFGLSFRWDLSQDKVITVTCIVTHALGHSEKTPLSAADDTSGGKNSIQAIGSTVTYLQRYTLLAATGLASKDSDDDGRGSVVLEYITEDEKTELIALLDECGVDETRWLKHCKLDSVDGVQGKDFESALANIKRWKK